MFMGNWNNLSVGLMLFLFGGDSLDMVVTHTGSYIAVSLGGLALCACIAIAVIFFKLQGGVSHRSSVSIFENICLKLFKKA